MEMESTWKDKLIVESFINKKRASIPCAVEQINTMLHILRHNEKPIRTFIDLGAGDGILSQLILEQLNDTQGYAIDFSEPMIEASHKKLANYSNRIKIIKSDISTCNWQDMIFTDTFEKVDAIVSGYCIHHLNHGRKYELYQEIFNRLTHNGLFVNIEHVASKSTWGEMISDELFIDSIVSFEENIGNNKSREQISRGFHNRADKKDNILLSADTQCEWLRLIGFKQVDIFFKCFELCVFAGKKLD